MTVGLRWRRKRDLVLYTAWRAGVPIRWLADVFDLSRTRVGRIVHALETGRPSADGSGGAFGRWLASELRKTHRGR